MSAPFDPGLDGKVPLFVTRRTAPPPGLPARATALIEDHAGPSPVAQVAALLDLADWIAERLAAVDPGSAIACLSLIANYQAAPDDYPLRPKLWRAMDDNRAILADIAARSPRNVLRSPPPRGPRAEPEDAA